MTVAVVCETCGKYVRMKVYRKHLRDVHGIGTDAPNASPASSPQHAAAQPIDQVKASFAKPGRFADAQAQSHPPRSVHPSVLSAGQRISHRVTAALAPAKKQRAALDQIFLAPEFCLYLLLTHQPAINTRLDAQMFLLKYKREIDGYLPLQNRGALIDLLADFMLEWSTRFPSQICLQFDCRIVKDGSDSFARIKGVGDIFLDPGSIKGTLPPPVPELSVMIAKEHENYRVDFVYEDTAAELVSTPTRVRAWAHRDDTHMLMPALKLRGDGLKKPRKPDPRSPSVMRLTALPSWPRTAQTSRARPVHLEVCPLCGKGVERGGMLMHKRDLHGETMYTPSPQQTARRCTWVAIYQGGAPGLGKGKS